jgi:hypothetical protein
MRRALALLELGPEGRKFMYAGKSGRPRSVREVARAVIFLPKTMVTIFGTRRRWAQSLA